MSTVVIAILGAVVLGMSIVLAYFVRKPPRVVTKTVVEKEVVEETPAFIQPAEFREIIVKVEEEAEDSGKVQLLKLRPGQEAAIGSASSSEITVSDKFASRKHAIITCSDGRWEIRDNWSRNGLFVDGQDITRASAELHDGSVVELGEKTKIHFHDIPSMA